MIWRPLYAGPAISTMPANRGSVTATIGAIIAPSLCPTSAMRAGSMSARARRNATAARMSSAKSALVPFTSPPEPPTPRSSSRSTAIPRRPSVSATCRKGRYPPATGMYSSRSCAPEPVMVTTAGQRAAAPMGLVSVPVSTCPARVGTVTSSAA